MVKPYSDHSVVYLQVQYKKEKMIGYRFFWENLEFEISCTCSASTFRGYYSRKIREWSLNTPLQQYVSIAVFIKRFLYFIQIYENLLEAVMTVVQIGSEYAERIWFYREFQLLYHLLCEIRVGYSKIEKVILRFAEYFRRDVFILRTARVKRMYRVFQLFFSSSKLSVQYGLLFCITLLTEPDHVVCCNWTVACIWQSDSHTWPISPMSAEIHWEHHER